MVDQTPSGELKQQIYLHFCLRRFEINKLLVLFFASVFSLGAIAAEELTEEEAARIVEEFEGLEGNEDGMHSEDELKDLSIAEAWKNADSEGDGALYEEEYKVVAAECVQSNRHLLTRV